MVANNKKRCVSRMKAGIVALGLALSATAGAHDLGVQGKMWDITEIDMRILVLQSVLRANFNEVTNDLKSSASKYLDQLPKRQMGVASKTETRWIDPSIETTGDLQTVTEDSTSKDYRWVTMFRKGTRVNPLMAFRPVTALLFFNGESDEEVAFVKKLLAEDEYGRVVLLEATGNNIAKLSKSTGRPVFYANDIQVRRFNITQTPALLYPASGEHDGHLGLTTFAAPFKVSDIRAVWELDITKSRGPGNGASK